MEKFVHENILIPVLVIIIIPIAAILGQFRMELRVPAGTIERREGGRCRHIDNL